MKNARTWKPVLAAVTAASMLIACTEDNVDMPIEGESEVTIAATVGNSAEGLNARTSSLIYGNIAITDVKISVDNIKMILRSTSEDSNKPSIVQLRGNNPQTLTLVENSQVMVAPVAVGLAGNGIYGKVNFDLVQAADVPEDDEMYGYSVITKATWFDTPAVMYIDLEDEVTFQFNQGLKVEGAQELLLTLYMDKFLEGISPTLVSDGNGDGLIEVGPNGEDGNDAAYQSILANIKEALVFKNGDFKSGK